MGQLKRSFFLLLFLITALSQNAWFPCTSHFWFLNSDCFQCSENAPEQRLTIFREKFEKNIFGQAPVLDHFLQIIEKRNTQLNKKTTSLFIAGHNGVGKSHTMSILKEALFSGATAQKIAFNILNGHNFFGTNATHGEKLQEMILSQLEICSNSLIIIDEVQMIHPNNLAFLEPILDQHQDYLSWIDRNNKHYKTFVNGATIAFISDFVKPADHKHISHETLISMMNQQILEVWGNPNFYHLIQYHVPFSTLTDTALIEILRHEIKNEYSFIKSVEVTPTAKTHFPTMMREIIGNPFQGRMVGMYINNYLHMSLIHLRPPKGKINLKIDWNNNKVELSSSTTFLSENDEL